MKAICFREVKTFFSSLIGYLVIAVFLFVNGLLLWFFDGDYNVLQSGFADLSPFFVLAPWVFIFLISAVTMRTFSEEIKQGTIELLLTKPLSTWEIVLGKFFGILLLCLLAILPTMVYILVVNNYLMPNQVFDLGSVIGSYFGLFFLASSYIAIGLFCSSFTSNQIIAFIGSVVLCVLFSLGISQLSTVLPYIEQLGVEYHFKSISKGVIDTRDLLYFVSLSGVFLGLTVFKINNIRK
ncbi:MAG: gliding motility-associated ABC transporter permease subunit GldF [Flavobacteriaceae bacterium]|jgi:ABC-2 type transport system permease protein|nr:gliding motility-associated ABC transporter permease subunit GldF [Flavobacteriaceae bacterium]